MSITKEYVDKIKDLSVSEKILIVEEIWDSIATDVIYPELSAFELVELDARINSSHANPQQGRTWDEIKTAFRQSK